MKLKDMLFFFLCFFCFPLSSQGQAIENRLKKEFEKQNDQSFEKKLDEKIKRLEGLEQRIQKDLQEIQAKEIQINQVFQNQKKEQKEGLEQMKKWVDPMNAESAALILRNLPNPLLNALLVELNEKKASSILEQLPPQKASEVIKLRTKFGDPTHFELMVSLGFCPACPIENPNPRQPQEN